MDMEAIPAYLQAPAHATDKAFAEYIWLAPGGQLKSRTEVLDAKPESPEQVPVVCVVEGNPEAGEQPVELVLRPRKVFRDPFRGGDHVLVLCDVFAPQQTLAGCPPKQGLDAAALPPIVLPHGDNTRVPCDLTLKVAEASQPVFGCEQQYAVVHPAYPTLVPLGPAKPSVAAKARRSSSHINMRCGSAPLPAKLGSWSPSACGGGTLSASLGGAPCGDGLQPAAQFCDDGAADGYGFAGQACCPGSSLQLGCCMLPGASAAASLAKAKSMARSMCEAHLRCCLYAGVKVTGAEALPYPGAHSYKVGPCQGVDFGDQVWASRYLLQRVAEDHGATVSWDPNAIPGCPQLGCPVKYSTSETRQPGTGLGAMQEQLQRLHAAHLQHTSAYSPDRPGALCVAGRDAFTQAVGTGDASVSVPVLTLMGGSGYYVDRRPPSNADPYTVAMLLASTTLGIPLPTAARQPRAPVAVPLRGGGMFGALPVAATNGGSSSGTWCRRSDVSNGTPCSSLGMRGEDEEDGDGVSFLDSDGMDTEGSYDLLLDELQRMDGCEGDGEGDEGGSCCESEGESESDGTSPDRTCDVYWGQDDKDALCSARPAAAPVAPMFCM